VLLKTAFGVSSPSSPQPCLTAAPVVADGIPKNWSVPSAAYCVVCAIAFINHGPISGSLAIAA
jgi:hypothetical protein